MKKLLLPIVLVLLFAGRAFPQNDSLRNLDINLENYSYPFMVSFLNIESQGEKLKMAYMDIQPERSNGKNILLLHGKNFNGAYWKKTAKALRDKGYRIIIPDQIGFGKSSKPAHFQYSFHLLASFTKQILDQLGIKKTSVLGHSMGGMIATRFSLMYPEAVEKLILENPLGLEDYKQKVPFQSIDGWYRNELKSNLKTIKEYQLTSYYHGEWKQEYLPWLNLLAGWTLNEKYPRIAWNSALTYDMIYTQPVCYEFDRIVAPTLLIIGQLDRSAAGKNMASEEDKKMLGNFPQLGKLTQAKIKNSQLVALDNVGHLPHIEDFERFIATLTKFLEETN